MKKEDTKLSDKQFRTETKKKYLVSKRSALIKFLSSFTLKYSNL